MVAILAGCAARKATPVAVSEYNDDLKSCQALATELTMIDQDIVRLKKEEDKTYQNAFFGAAAVFLYVPALFMDFGTAEREEIAALQERKRHLLVIGVNKKCDFKTEEEKIDKPN